MGWARVRRGDTQWCDGMHGNEAAGQTRRNLVGTAMPAFRIAPRRPRPSQVSWRPRLGEAVQPRRRMGGHWKPDASSLRDSRGVGARSPPKVGVARTH